MKKPMTKGAVMLLLVIFIMQTFSAAVFAADTTTATVTVLGTSDMHGYIYPHDYPTDSVSPEAGFAKIQTLVKLEKEKAPNALLIDCGDTVQDNMAELFNNEDPHPMVKALNAIGYDTWTLGNHEFNFGLGFLEKNMKGFKGDVVVANIYKEDGTRYAKPYSIIEKDGVRIAIVGLITPNIPTWEASTPDNFKGLKFTDPVEEAKKVVAELEGKYDVLIGAVHMGDTAEYGTTDGATPIAEACPQFSALFCGHKHSKFDNITVNGVKLIEPGAYGAALAKATIALEKTADKWAVKSVETKNIASKDAAPDADILKQFEYVHKASLEEVNKVVGEVTEDFIKRPDYITGADKITTMPTSQIEDTAIIDLINEVQLSYTGADVSSAALFNFGSNLKKGPFKKKDVAFIYKYTNTLNGVKITGENLKKYMEWSASYYNTYKDGDVTISFNPDVRGYNYDMFTGIKYEIDISQAAGSRIKNVTFKGKPLDDKAVFKLALNNYRLGTILGLKLVKKEDVYYDSFKLYQDAGRIRDLIIKYVQEKKGGKLAPTVDNNWKITGTNFNSAVVEKAFELIRSGKVALPASQDGRTLNVKALNVNDLVAAGLIKEVNYTVKSGDVLWKIAKKFGTTWEKLAEVNKLKNPHLILPGQVLVAPLPSP